MADTDEELNIRQQILDRLTREQAILKQRQELVGKSLSVQEQIQSVLQTEYETLTDKREKLRAESKVNREILRTLQAKRQQLERQNGYEKDQQDLFNSTNLALAQIDQQILTLKGEIAGNVVSQSALAQDLRTNVGKQLAVDESILATKIRMQSEEQQRLSEVESAKQSQLTSAIRRGNTLGNAFKTGTILEKIGMFADAVSTLGKVAMQVLTTVYDIQRQIGVEIGSAVRQYRGALIQSAKSFFSFDGPLVSSKEIIDASAAFTKEFGTILDPKESARIAKDAKNFGVSSAEIIKAKRAFLSTGAEDATRNKVITEFKNAGLTGAQALKFAADNANLVAIAGVKYADALARAAANATKIGVSLSSTERFADTIVGDFEGALAGFAEASAMGLEIDIGKIFKASAIGGPEGIQKELSAQLGGNQALLRELQTNRNLKLAVQSAFPGLDINEIIRLSGGTEQKPAELTVAEQSRDYLAQIVELLGKGGGAAAKITKVAAGAVQGGAAGAIAGAPVAGIGAVPGLIAGGVIGGAAALFGDDVISQPGYGTRALVTEQGVINLNNQDTVLAGTQLLSAGNLTNAPQGITGTPTMYPGNLQETRVIPQQQSQQTNVTVDMSKLEAKLDKLASAFSAIKIEMDGNTVGRVSLNARSPIDRLAVVG
jgi:hypothetical protein